MNTFNGFRRTNKAGKSSFFFLRNTEVRFLFYSSIIVTLKRYWSIGCYFLSNKIQFANKSVTIFIFNHFIDRNHIKQNNSVWTRYTILLHENFNPFKTFLSKRLSGHKRNNKNCIHNHYCYYFACLLHLFPCLLIWSIFICGQ